MKGCLIVTILEKTEPGPSVQEFSTYQQSAIYI